MEFQEITDEHQANPGEYIYHVPSGQIVLCGKHIKEKKIINVMSQGRLFEDKVENFKKILLNNQRQKKLKITRCGKCGK